jgi:hypothetical protein
MATLVYDGVEYNVPNTTMQTLQATLNQRLGVAAQNWLPVKHSGRSALVLLDGPIRVAIINK